MIARLLTTTAVTLWTVLVVAYILRDQRVRRLLPEPVWRTANAVFFELKPFTLPMILTVHFGDLWVHGDPANPARMIGTGIALAFWAMIRNTKDDDDRWNRRRKRLTERVSQVDGRLVVLPAGASR